MEDSPRKIHGESIFQVDALELISESVDHQGSFSILSPVSSESDDYEWAYRMPDDNHLFPVELALGVYDSFETVGYPGDGSISFLQMYNYKMSNCGLRDPVALPNSGYRITHTLRTRKDGAVMAITTKRAENVELSHEGKTYSTNKGITNRINRLNEGCDNNGGSRKSG